MGGTSYAIHRASDRLLTRFQAPYMLKSTVQFFPLPPNGSILNANAASRMATFPSIQKARTTPRWHSYLTMGSHRAERKTPCQDGTAVRECSKMILRLKMRPDGAVIQEWSWPLERPCLRHSEREQPCRLRTSVLKES